MDPSPHEPRPVVLRVAHLADVHIRKDRLKEHRGVTDILITKLREESPDVIIVAGESWVDQ